MTVTREQLDAAITAGDVDTVLMVFPDMFGRLVGKRTTGRFFREHIADAGTENCDYLLACDIDNVPVPGARFASYDKGYGDIVARADWATARILPWIDRTAMIFCDVFDVVTGEAVEVAPRRVLARQVEAAAQLGFVPMLGSEIEFYLFHDSYDEAHAVGYRGLRPHSPWVEDYHVLQTTRDEYVIGAIRRGLEGAGVPVECSKGEAGRGQHEVNLDYAEAVEMADRNAIYKNAAKEIAASLGRSISFMAKYDSGDTGSSCHIHSSLWTLDERRAAFDPGEPANGHVLPLSPLFEHYLAGLIHTAREFSLLWAPTVNSYKRFQPGSWAPTGVAWGIDNRTLGFRVVGHGGSTRVESRIPGSDANSYLAFAGTIAGGLYGIREQLELPPVFEGNGYEATELPRIPSSLIEAIELWESSEIAAACFGDAVHDHILTMAHFEWREFNRAVTDWETMRYFERI